jgi:hypothetical protein
MPEFSGPVPVSIRDCCSRNLMGRLGLTARMTKALFTSRASPITEARLVTRNLAAALWLPQNGEKKRSGQQQWSGKRNISGGAGDGGSDGEPCRRVAVL